MVIKRISTLVCILTVTLASESARGDSDDELMSNAGQNVFEYGSTCENLGQLSRVELVGVTHQTYAEHFGLFCKPDSVYRCDDYNAVVGGLGRLEDNGRGSCRYIPNASK